MSTDAEPAFVHGARTTALVAELREMGVGQVSLLMRHSAREYAPGRHDLENPLTEEGRRLAREFGLRLPPELVLRGYASPVPRCQDTAELIHAAHLEAGGRGSGGCRPVEALGVFYVLDQMRMFKAMSTAGEGLAAFVDGWMAGRVPEDVMMAPRLAAQTLLRLLVGRLDSQAGMPALDLCVSHDLTLYLMRDVLLGLHRGDGDVRYLDGLALWRDGDAVLAATHDAEATDVTALLG
ncbi:MAG: histidine phosphatase family protein [Pseudomonadales bacterium]|jgi:broad specificity phosphatase PhoE|nr:histidine phosphatase family protein [Pseudomonadales bacterium]